MTGEILIKVDNVSKKFCRKLKRSLWYGAQDIAEEVLGRHGRKCQLRPDEFWATKGVSFEIRRGECLGLIGRNGAGKTTLLRMLNGLIKPDEGQIEMAGRVGALIALGAGFNPILTGRENIFVNGSVLGLTKKEIDRKFDEIVEFSELENFIDSPVRGYSSGMQVRLGFAVATALVPDILLLDEVLAVGDAGFRIKCYNRIAEIKKNTAVILVSHNMFDLSSVSTLGCILEHGQVTYNGGIEPAIEAYNSMIKAETDAFSFMVDEITVREFKIQDAAVTWASSPTFLLDFDSLIDIEDVFIRLMFTDIGGNVIAEWNSKNYSQFFRIVKGRNEIVFTVENMRLRNDKYSIILIVTSGSGRDYIINLRHTFEFIVAGGIYTSSHYVI